MLVSILPIVHANLVDFRTTADNLVNELNTIELMCNIIKIGSTSALLAHV